MKFNIVRTDIAFPVLAAFWDAVREFLFRCLDGMGNDDKRAWRRFWHRVKGMEAGEVIEIEMTFPRNPKFHRKFFALLNVGFDAWQPNRKRKSYKGKAMQKNFEQFREDVTILAGWYEQTFNIRGEMVLRAKSVSFTKMDDAEFEKLYSAIIDVLLRDVCANYKTHEEIERVVDNIIAFHG
jgi:hypothetical protein